MKKERFRRITKKQRTEETKIKCKRKIMMRTRRRWKEGRWVMKGGGRRGRGIDVGGRWKMIRVRGEGRERNRKEEE